LPNRSEPGTKKSLSAGEIFATIKQFGCAIPQADSQPCEANACFNALFRTFDGTCNNMQNPTTGAAATALRRAFSPSYEDNDFLPSGSCSFFPLTFCRRLDNPLS